MMKTPRILVFGISALMVALGMAGCGQTGSLYLPDKTASSTLR